MVMEAAWCYDTGPPSAPLCANARRGLPPEIKEIAWKAQHRLHKRYRGLLGAGKDKRKVVTAVGRELLGFIWTIGVQVESNSNPRTQVAA
jgi:transposase